MALPQGNPPCQRGEDTAQPCRTDVVLQILLPVVTQAGWLDGDWWCRRQRGTTVHQQLEVFLGAAASRLCEYHPEASCTKPVNNLTHFKCCFFIACRQVNILHRHNQSYAKHQCVSHASYAENGSHNTHNVIM